MAADTLMEKYPKHKLGEPSPKIYVKNLSKTATIADLERVFGAFADDLSDIKVFTEGRMHGQAFVSFPDVAAALRAIRAVHGYVLHGKPMLLSFAKATT